MGKRIGLKKIDIDNILNNKKIYSESVYLSAGPIYGDGSLYGTISLHDF